MLPPPTAALAIAFGIGIARAVPVGQAGPGGAEVAGVAGVLLVPGAALVRDLAARMDHVGAVVEVQRATAHGLVVGDAVVALVHARRRHEVGLGVAGEADLAGAIALRGGLAVGREAFDVRRRPVFVLARDPVTGLFLVGH